MSIHFAHALFFGVGVLGVRKVRPERQCRECRTNFVVTREWQVFCSPGCRVSWNKRWRATCFYCGSLADPGHREHVTPHMFQGRTLRRYWSGVEYVIACGVCNLLLGSHMMVDMTDRVDHLIAAYTRKHGLHKGAVRWDEDELDELGRGLRARIKKALAQRRLAEEKIIYLQHLRMVIIGDTNYAGEEAEIERVLDIASPGVSGSHV